VIVKARAKKPLAPMQYAVAQLARREHSRAELRNKLRRRLKEETEPAEAAAQIEMILDDLQEKGLLSDARFAAVLTRSRAQRFGAARIRYEMREHDLPDEVVRPAMEQLKATEEARARDLWKRRFGHPPADATERARQMRFLAQRGFSTAVVLRVVRSAVAED
jgi:regulatory protein